MYGLGPLSSKARLYDKCRPPNDVGVLIAAVVNSPLSKLSTVRRRLFPCQCYGYIYSVIWSYSCVRECVKPMLVHVAYTARESSTTGNKMLIIQRSLIANHYHLRSGRWSQMNRSRYQVTCFCWSFCSCQYQCSPLIGKTHLSSDKCPVRRYILLAHSLILIAMCPLSDHVRSESPSVPFTNITQFFECEDVPRLCYVSRRIVSVYEWICVDLYSPYC